MRDERIGKKKSEVKSIEDFRKKIIGIERIEEGRKKIENEVEGV